jgi:hypothetical protein
LPEEVIIGVSVLQKAVMRLPVIVTCVGEGTTGKPGTLKLQIRNPNPVPLQEATIYIDQIDELRDGKRLNTVVKANSDEEIDLPIGQTPTPDLNAEGQEPANAIRLKGRVVFRFSNVEPGEAIISESNSVFNVNQIFQSGGIDIDEFL